MRAKPLPPTIFSKPIHLKLYVLLILATSVTLACATVFTYYAFTLAVSQVDPPVIFKDLNTPGVSVELYEDATKAEIQVASPGILVLTKRSAFVWDDYSDNPFTSGRLTVNAGTWSWNPAGYIAVSASSLASSWGGACVAHYAASPPAGTSMVHVLVKELHITNANNQYSGLIMADSPSLFNLMGYRRGTGANRFITIRRLSGAAWTTVTEASLRLAENTWFIFLGRREYAGSVSFTVYDTTGIQQGSPLSAIDTAFTVNLVGVGVYRAGGTITAYFDDFVACADANPRFINVTGLEEGWTVYLYDGGGSLLNQATAGSDGKACLDVLTRPIVRNARLEVKQGDMVILPSQSFSEVVGGDVYECSVKDMGILGFQNQDSKVYNAYLKVESVEVPEGYFGSINLWIGPGFGTTPIQIVGSNVLVDTTSEVTLEGFADSIIHGTFSLSPTPPSQIVLTLSFHYYVPSSKVEVEYPVRVVIHG
ncbi:MAG: hypothetical protein JTT13_08155 [Candidatus Brockarchaeota archaeon]|nr:hypothetical protein [Candidatus Brockarchaeota archaeon]